MNPVGRLFIRAHVALLRATKGKRFNMGGKVLVLETVGARSGRVRANPLMYMPLDGGRLAIFASAAGAPTSPGWHHNLVAQPDVHVDLDGERRAVRARVTEEPERSELYAKVAGEEPRFAGYQEKTSRVIPVVVLEPR